MTKTTSRPKELYPKRGNPKALDDDAIVRRIRMMGGFYERFARYNALLIQAGDGCYDDMFDDGKED